jgi:hypothetical protein
LHSIARFKMQCLLRPRVDLRIMTLRHKLNHHSLKIFGKNVTKKVTRALNSIAENRTYKTQHFGGVLESR